MLVIRAYIAIVEKFEEQNPHLKYDADGPLFVNQLLTKFKDNKRVLDTSFISEIAEVDRIKSYDFRRMYASYVGNSKSLILRQYFAIAASHRCSFNYDKFRTIKHCLSIVLRLSSRPMCPSASMSGGL